MDYEYYKSISDIYDALEVGNIELVDFYYNNDKYKLSKAIDQQPKINPIFIDYFLSKDEFMRSKLAFNSSYILGLIYIKYKDFDSYKLLLEKSKYDYNLLKIVIDVYSKTGYDEQKRVFLVTLDVYQHKMKLLDAFNIIYSSHETQTNNIVYCNCLSYVVFRLINDNEELKQLTNEFDYEKIVLVCYKGYLPDILIELLLKYVKLKKRILIESKFEERKEFPEGYITLFEDDV